MLMAMTSNGQLDIFTIQNGVKRGWQRGALIVDLGHIEACPVLA